MKVGLFGGSFNPIHNSHVGLAKHLLENNVVEEVWIMPCAKHVYNKSLEDVNHRVKMINLATEEIQGIRIEDIEIKSGKAEYTIDTVKKLKKKFSHEFSLVIGSDLLHDIENWKGGKELREEISFIVIGREGYEIKPVSGVEVLYALEENPSKLSSTLIREKIRENKSLDCFVAPRVANYIKQEGLYK